MILRIPASVHKALADDARAASPREICGFLVGRYLDTSMMVEEIIPTLNVAVLVGGFSIPDAEVRRVTQRAARAQLALIAVYHSHPSGTLSLSATDAHALQRSPYPWLIVGTSTSAVAAYSPDGAPLALKLD